MTSWKPEDLSPRGPVYLAIADTLARDVDAGLLRPGERLPTHRALARTLGVNVVTVTRAYAEAARRGLVEGEVGRGTFVSRREVATGSHLPLQPDRGLIDFRFNLPALGEGVHDPAALLSSLVADGVDPLEARYVPAGLPEHRAAGAAWMGRSGLDADPERTLVTSGGQHAMSVAFATLTAPGDTILTEELTYPGVKALAGLQHLRTLPVALDEEGLVPAALETACRKSNPKVLYCMPTLQNPTGIVWSEARRHEVLEVARRYGLVVVEDDTTAFLVEDPPPPLAALAPEDVLYLTSVSKSLGAGLRIGYLHLPRRERRELEALAERFGANIAAQNWMTAPILAELVARLIEGGEADRIVAWRRKECRRRRHLLDRALGDHGSASDPRSSFVWLPLPEPWRSEDFAEEARRAGVAVNTSEAFVVGRAHAPHTARICIGTPRDRGEVERGLAILADLVQSARPRCRSFV
jgi:DNA-binding transcriptional MocR family regulator